MLRTSCAFQTLSFPFSHKALSLTRSRRSINREKLANVPDDSPHLAYGNTVYGIKFDTRTPPSEDTWFGHRYTFFLQDAVEEVPEYVVYWDKFVE